MLKTKIFNAAVSLAKKDSVEYLTRLAVATRSGAAEATVSYYFGSMEDLRKKIMEFALDEEIIEILANTQLTKYWERISPALKTRIANHITGR